MVKLQMNRIHKAFTWLQKEFHETDELQSVDVLIHRLDLINASLAFVNEQMAVAKKELNEAKSQAYNNLVMSSHAQQIYYAPSLAKDFIASKCSLQAYNYDMTERLSRALVHISDNLRTGISAMKEIVKLENYSSNVPMYR